MNIIYKGLFLTEESANLLREKITTKRLEKKVPDLHITFEFKPVKPFPEEVLGKTFTFKVIGEGNNNQNHGFLVQLPEELIPYYKGKQNIHITYSLAHKAKAVSTSKLKFHDIEPFELEGTLGHYTTKGKTFIYPPYLNKAKKKQKALAKPIQKIQPKKEKEKPFSYPEEKINETKEQLKKNNEQLFQPIKGFSSGTEVIAACKRIGLPKTHYYIIGNKNGFFAVAFDGWSKQVLVAKEHAYYRTQDGTFSTISYPSGKKIPYAISKRAKAICKTILAQEFLKAFPETKVWYFEQKSSTVLNVENKPMNVHNYLIIMGALFFNRSFTKDEFYEIDKYFKNPEAYLSVFKEGVLAVNPFKQTVTFVDGSTTPIAFVGGKKGYVIINHTNHLKRIQSQSN